MSYPSTFGVSSNKFQFLSHFVVSVGNKWVAL